MNTKINRKNYKPINGFYDLTTIAISTASEFHKLAKLQKVLAFYEDRKEYLKQNEPLKWEKVKNLSAEYQQIILEYTQDNQICYKLNDICKFNCNGLCRESF